MQKCTLSDLKRMNMLMKAKRWCSCLYYESNSISVKIMLVCILEYSIAPNDQKAFQTLSRFSSWKVKDLPFFSSIIGYCDQKRL